MIFRLMRGLILSPARANSVPPSKLRRMRSSARSASPNRCCRGCTTARLCRMLLPHSVDGDEAEPWVYLRAIEEISRHDGSVGWNVFVANSSALIAPFLAPDAMRTIFADPRAIVAWGPPNASKATRRAGRLPCHRALGFRLRLPAGDLDGRALPRGGAGRFAAAECGRQTDRADAALSGAQATLLNTWNVIGMRGTASDS